MTEEEDVMLLAALTVDSQQLPTNVLTKACAHTQNKTAGQLNDILVINTNRLLLVVSQDS